MTLQPKNLRDLRPILPDESDVDRLLAQLSWIAETANAGGRYLSPDEMDPAPDQFVGMGTNGRAFYAPPEGSGAWIPPAPPPELKMSLQEWRQLATVLLAYYEIEPRLAPKPLDEALDLVEESK